MTPEKLKNILSGNGIFIKNESIIRLSGGKDNSTFSALLKDGRKIVIQYMQSIRSDLHAEFIEKAVHFTITSDPSIGFARNPLDI